MIGKTGLKRKQARLVIRWNRVVRLTRREKDKNKRSFAELRKREIVSVGLRARYRVISPLTGEAPQISRAYSRIARSAANRPAWAMFTRDIRFQAVWSL